MKLAVITVTFNNVTTIERCLKSVKDQLYCGLVHIVINGNSSDGTTKIINGQCRANLHHFCEDDDSMWDAMNKGILYAINLKIDYVCFLNSDDVFSSNYYVQNVACVLQERKYDFIYGSVNIGVFGKNQFVVKRNYPTYPMTKTNILRGYMPPHPGCFHRLNIYKEIGLLSMNSKLSPDFHFFALATKNKSTYFCMSETSVLMGIEGISNSNHYYIVTRILRQSRTTKIVYNKYCLFTILMGKVTKLFNRQ